MMEQEVMKKMNEESSAPLPPHDSELEARIKSKMKTDMSQVFQNFK